MLVLFDSCSTEDGPTSIETEIMPMELSEIYTPNGIVGSSSLNKNSNPNITKVWNTTDYGESRFLLDETNVKTIRERDVLNNEIFTFRFLREGPNFIYGIDDSRELYIALPIWNAGKNAHAYFREPGSSWVQWRIFKYSSCINDTTKPTIASNPDAPLWYEQYRRDGFINFSNMILCLGEENPKLLDYIPATRAYLNITDNCDQDLTFIQTPAPGTIITQSQHLTGQIRVIDDNSNELIVRFYDYIRLCN
ncbi:hypothetical protein [Aquimarina brevivitae]|nr:hypothetical protein [Aquimarina brevivitae]